MRWGTNCELVLLHLKRNWFSLVIYLLIL
jgi:hypothetical protein